MRVVGVALLGPAPRDLLGPIAPGDLRRALRDALPELLGDLRGDERNVLLTLARMWHTAATGAFVPKDAAAVWAAARLPAELGGELGLACGAYVGARVDDWHGRDVEVAALAERLWDEIDGACTCDDAAGH